MSFFKASHTFNISGKTQSVNLLRYNQIMTKWFKVWNRPEYKEWALPTSYGYLLVIIRKQPQDYLLAKAKLIVKPKGLPLFETLEEKIVKSKQQANHQIKDWQTSP